MGISPTSTTTSTTKITPTKKRATVEDEEEEQEGKKDRILETSTTDLHSQLAVGDRRFPTGNNNTITTTTPSSGIEPSDSNNKYNYDSNADKTNLNPNVVRTSISSNLSAESWDYLGSDQGSISGGGVNRSGSGRGAGALAGGGNRGGGYSDNHRYSRYNNANERPDALSGAYEADNLEMDSIGSDDNNLNDDEETSLTAHQRRKQWLLRKRQRREVDSQIPDGKGTSIAGMKLADRDVMQKLAVNALFIGLWYFFAVSISLYNRWMFSPKNLDFQYPLFTTSLHMLVQFSLASTILYFFPTLRPLHNASSSHQYSTAGQGQNSKSILTAIFYFTRLVPCGTATSLDIGLGNMSLRFISLTFLTMCKSSALGFVLLFAFLFRLETPSMKLIFIICIMTVGVVMMVAAEEAFDVLGFSLIIASAFFSGFRWGLTQILLLRHPATANPFSTLFLLTPIMFVSLLVIAMSIEGPSEIIHGVSELAAAHGNLNVTAFLLFPGILAFCMIAAEFALLKRSSVVTLSICGIFKEVITIAAAGIFYNEPLSPVNVTGLFITLTSIGSYNYLKIAKMRKDAQMDLAEENDRDLESDDEYDYNTHDYDGPHDAAGAGTGSSNSTSRGHSPGQRYGFFNRIGAALGLEQTPSSKYQPIYTPEDPESFNGPSAPSGNTSGIGPDADDNGLTSGGADDRSRGRGSVRARVSGSAGSFPTLNGPDNGILMSDSNPKHSRGTSGPRRSKSRPRADSPDRWNR